MRAAIDAEPVFSAFVGRAASGRSGKLASEASRCCGGSFDSSSCIVRWSRWLLGQGYMKRLGLIIVPAIKEALKRTLTWTNP